ncbi:hypothetical protein F2P56_019703 [Juglans regia]|uniref:Uncharacterized protein LOC108979827 n=2 Tax=Juglans regia TaxID=51240 RepID=A0A2I4DG59_JUGRE|nr:uncharacterized protein LOC108979827 [Juglans regia]KAF5459785.1 hypothetical protein F2P56_019703 [Juglans regia]
MRQKRWFELIKDYDCTINYHPNKANVVADALSRKSMGSAVAALTTQHRLLMDLERASIEIIASDTNAFMASLVVQPALIDRIKVSQQVDSGLVKLVEEFRNRDKSDFNVSEDGVLRFRGRLCILADDALKRVKAEHHRPAEFLQPLQIPKWKWEHISMDFVRGLPRTLNGQDAIWVIADCLTKTARFVPIKVSFKLEKLAKLYV